MKTLTEIHNETVGEIVASIVLPTIKAGGGAASILVVLESVIVGVMIVVAKPGRDEIVLARLFDGVKERLAKLRLEDIGTEDSA